MLLGGNCEVCPERNNTRLIMAMRYIIFSVASDSTCRVNALHQPDQRHASACEILRRKDAAAMEKASDQ